MRQDSPHRDIVHAVHRCMALLVIVKVVKGGGGGISQPVVGSPSSLITDTHRNGGVVLQPVA